LPVLGKGRQIGARSMIRKTTDNRLLVVLQIALLLGVGCHKDSRGERNRRMQATVLLDKTTVQLGDDLEIRITGVPAGWSGTMWVNSGRHRFELLSTRYVLKATRENGFSVWAPTEIYFFLKDRQFTDIPITHSVLTVRVVDRTME
jgi:hypothetical protein